MNPGTENKIDGKIHEVKGIVKEKIGQVTSNPTLEGEGIAERVVGKIQEKIGQIQEEADKPSPHQN
jgi:uncharacterized protein YjbJ (UPF0337 family)